MTGLHFVVLFGRNNEDVLCNLFLFKQSILCDTLINQEVISNLTCFLAHRKVQTSTFERNYENATEQLGWSLPGLVIEKERDLFRIKPKEKKKQRNLKGIERKKRFSKNRGRTLRPVTLVHSEYMYIWHGGGKLKGRASWSASMKPALSEKVCKSWTRFVDAREESAFDSLC